MFDYDDDFDDKTFNVKLRAEIRSLTTYIFSIIKIISTPQCKAFICDGCKAKIDEHYQFKMQCIKNVNLQRFNNGTIGPIAETPGSSTEGSEPTATASALVEAIPSSSSKAD